MSATDSALVDFGEAMAKVQRSRNAGDGGGFSEQGLKTALEVVDSLYAMGQTSDASLEAGVAGSLMELMQRRLHFARSAVRDGLSVGEALEQAIAVFITRVWRGAFAGAPPSSRDRRTAVATYRFAFDRASRRRSAAAKAAEAGSKLIQTDDDAEAAPENGVSL